MKLPALAASYASLVLVACVAGAPVVDPDAGPEAPAPPARTPFRADLAAELCYGEGRPLFVDATPAAGVGHVFEIDPHEETHVRSLGGGAALDDLDGDGDLDLYVSNAGGKNALYLNHGDGTFEDHASERGVDYARDRTLGASAADYDNDGDQDLLLLNRGGSRLLQNLGDAHFVDVTAASGLTPPLASASAVWSDIDRDGHLDVVIAAVASRYDRLSPPSLSETKLFRNRGDGTFEHIAEIAPGATLPKGSCYVALAQDLDDDGWPELLLPEEFAHMVRNHLYRNTAGSFVFDDVSTDAIIDPQAPMGGALVDPDGDGRPDVFLTNLFLVPPFREVLWKNSGALQLRDAPEFGAAAMAPYLDDDMARAVSWGAAAFDRENDGDDDLYIVYGGFTLGPDIPWELDFEVDRDFVKRAPNAYLELTDGVFQERPGSCAEEMGTGRGVVSGDLDDDGCVDLYVVNQGSPARFLRNRCEDVGALLSLQLRGSDSNRDAIGARVEVTAAGKTQVKRVSGGSLVLYGSNPKRLYFGLGSATVAERVVIRWPSGRSQVLLDQPAGGLIEIVEPGAR